MDQSILVIDFGRPVERNILCTLAWAAFKCSIVDSVIVCVPKLTRVPSISKNKALVIRQSFYGCKSTKKIGPHIYHSRGIFSLLQMIFFF